MLLNALATLVLFGMMLVPFVNIIVGAVVGGGLAGPQGMTFGILLALSITAAELYFAKLFGWSDLACASEEAVEQLAALGQESAAALAERADPPTIRTAPAAGRRRLGGYASGRRTQRPSEARLSHAR
jgi:hypothetical protein